MSYLACLEYVSIFYSVIMCYFQLLPHAHWGGRGEQLKAKQLFLAYEVNGLFKSLISISLPGTSPRTD